MKCILSCDWPWAPLAALHCTLCLCIRARSYMFARLLAPAYLLARQHLVICDLEINTVIMCGSLFILSRRSVFSKLNRFCHSVGTSLGLSHCVDHIRGGLLGRWTTPRCSLNAGSCSGPAPSSAYLNSVFTDGVWHAGPYRSLGGAGRSGVKWSETGKGRGQGKRDSIEWRRDGGGGRLRPHWKGAQS